VVLILLFTVAVPFLAGVPIYVNATTPPTSKTITITIKAIILLFVKTPP
jgi:hypothetical protein